MAWNRAALTLVFVFTVTQTVVADAGHDRRAVGYVDQTRAPDLTGPVVVRDPRTGKPVDFNFHCQVHYDQRQPNAAFRVKFTFSDGSTALDQLIKAPVDKVTLNSSYWRHHVGQELGCSATPLGFVGNTPSNGPTQSSRTYKGEIQIEDKVLLKEGGHGMVQVKSTLPVICECPNSVSCQISVEFRPHSAKVLTVDGSCKTTLSPADWDERRLEAKTFIALTSTIDHVVRGDDLYQVEYDLINADHCGGSDITPSVWDSYHLPKTYVGVKEVPLPICSLSSDPHLRGFAGGHKMLLMLGDYQMHRSNVLGLDFEIQQRHDSRDHHSNAAYICAVAVRAGHEIVTIDVCARDVDGADVTSNREEELSFLAVHREESPLVSYRVTAATGQQLDVSVIDNYFLNTDLYVTSGLEDDPGTTTCSDKVAAGSTLTVAEAARLMVPRDRNLFRLDTRKFFALPDPTIRPPKYCMCPASGEQAGIRCSPFVSTFDLSAQGLWNPLFPTFQARDEPLQNFTAGGKRWKRVKPRYHVPSHLSDLDNDYPSGRQSVNYAWPTGSGITEKEARDDCRQSLTHFSRPACLGFLDLAPFIEECVRDTQVTGDYSMLSGTISAYEQACRARALRSAANYQPVGDGSLQPLPHWDRPYCPGACSRHGACVNGTCHCKGDYYGDSCALKRGPPVLRPLRRNICDAQKEHCHLIKLSTKNFDEKKADRYTCSISYFKEENGRFTPDNSSVSHSFPLEFLNPSLSICNVTSYLNSTAAGLRVRLESATEPGSNSVDYFVFDGKCRLCQQDQNRGFVCFHKVNTCHIDGRCWAEGETNGKGGVCNPSVHFLQWS